MTSSVEIGDRVSFSGASCTVRYTGKVDGTEGEWLGVEWDDATRGKHNGSREGKQYFKCLSPLPTAGSFVRPSRRRDSERSFLEAIRYKYATQDTIKHSPIPLDKEIVISGKVAEEVGFDKIREEQAQLHELKIVIVDGLQIKYALKGDERIGDVCPKIVELDLSRNLFESLDEVALICKELPSLKKLRLNGNRFMVIEQAEQKRRSLKSLSWAFQGIIELELNETLLSWKELTIARSHFECLQKLEASSNQLTKLEIPMAAQKLKSLTLEYNEITNLSHLAFGVMDMLDTLEVLRLKGNKISTMKEKMTVSVGFKFGSQLQYLDISYNRIDSWAFVDSLPSVFPGLTSLRLSHNPVYDKACMDAEKSGNFDEGYMLTLARLGNLKVLNFSNITAAERTNAEMYYLSRIAKEMAEVSEKQEKKVASEHKRYAELCRLYGSPIVVRKKKGDTNPFFLEARLIRFTFTMAVPGSSSPKVKQREIPKTFDVYRVKGLVGAMFGVPPLKLRLVWETGEWDPVSGYGDEIDPEIDSEEEEATPIDQEQATINKKGGGWIKREVEIEDSTRPIGNWVDGLEATVRVDCRP